MKSNHLDPQESDLPIRLSQPARRALAGAGYTRLDQLTEAREADLKKLHGLGPRGIDMVREALASRGLSFADSRAKKD